ncbi:MAG: hypothetical protein U1E65_30240 [Myxococcota bacterium]
MSRSLFLSFPLALFLSSACSTGSSAIEQPDAQAAMPDAQTMPDAGFAPDAAAAPDSGCTPLAPGDGVLSEGGRTELHFGADTMASLAQVVGSEGLEVHASQDGVVLWSTYGATTSQALRLERSGCPDTVVPIAVRPLTWEKLAQWDAMSGPPAREYGAYWPGERDGARGTYIYGGFKYYPRQFTPANDLWFFDYATKTWAEISTPAAPLAGGARFAEGPSDGTLFLFGGGTPAADGSLDTPSRLQILSLGDGSFSWQSAAHEAASPGSYTGAFFRDAANDRWISACGADSQRLGVNCAVSSYTVAGGWQTLTVAGDAPVGRYGFLYTYIPEDNRMILVGGDTGGEVLGDTWALELGDSPRWVKLFDSDPAVARRNGAFVYDPVGRRLILWGGTKDGRTAVPGLSILRTERGLERWDHLPTPSFVPPRASGFAVYDPDGSRAVMGFGNAAAIYTDLFALSL